MPYIVHAKDTEPTDESTRYTSRAEAYRVISQTPGLVVTFLISQDERKEWRMREYQRFQDGVYALPPWIGSLVHCWEPSNSEDQDGYKYPALAHHFAHLSLKQTGCIAYTPSDESGYQDKQTTIKVGRYLEEHARGYFSQEQINSFVDRVKGFNADLQLAKTADEIYTIYRNTHRGSLGSCMSHPTEDYSTRGIHPTAVYGDSDLALAYLGSVEEPTARCIVWPEKKRYTRIYGDTTLEAVLKKSGYTYEDGQNYGNLEGARVRAIKVPGSTCYVMPYVDAATSADLDEDGKYFVLHDDDSGEYDVHNADYTDGITHEKSSGHSCDHCGDVCDDDDASYCSSCEDDRISCQRCDDTHFDASDDGRFIGDDWYCTHCADRHYTHECDGCGDTWDEVNPDSSYCDDCRDHYISCDDCSEYFDTRECDSSGDVCDDCHKAKEDEDETEADEDGQTAEVTPLVLGSTMREIMITSDGMVPDAPSVPSDVYPTINDYLDVLVGTTVVRVAVICTSGAFAVHNRAEDSDEYPSYTVTHIPSCKAIAREALYSRAVELAQLLSTPGIDWAFTREADSKSSTRELARYIVRNRALPLGNCVASQILRTVNPSLFVGSEDTCTLF